jgi:hypothetical protein
MDYQYVLRDVQESFYLHIQTTDRPYLGLFFHSDQLILLTECTSLRLGPLLRIHVTGGFWERDWWVLGSAVFRPSTLE